MMFRSNAEKEYVARFPDARRLDETRGMARDEIEEYPRAHKAIEGGVDAVAAWCAENFSKRDIEKLIDALNKVLNERVRDTITGDSRRARAPMKRSADPAIRATTDKIFADFHGEKDYLERFPDAQRLAR